MVKRALMGAVMLGLAVVLGGCAGDDEIYGAYPGPYATYYDYRYYGPSYGYDGLFYGYRGYYGDRFGGSPYRYSHPYPYRVHPGFHQGWRGDRFQGGSGRPGFHGDGRSHGGGGHPGWHRQLHSIPR